MKGSVLVVGGGISGMRSSAELLQQGFRVYLLEESPTIGGKMAQLDKMYPSNECATCTQLPKMLELTSNPNMTIIAFAELVGITGVPGNFTVKALKKPRFVDPVKCTACTDCFPVCPVGGIPMEFNLGRGTSKAISFYSPFPPRKALINPEKCSYILTGKCGDDETPPCVKACQVNAVDFTQKPKEAAIEVGAIIIATGADEGKGDIVSRYGYGRLPNVLTSLEFERLLSGLGPTSGIVRRDDKLEPKKVAWIVCDNASPVPLLSASAEALGVKERDPEAEAFIFYEKDMPVKRSCDAFRKMVMDRGVKYIRIDSVEVKGSDNGNLALSWSDSSGNKGDFRAEMLVLAVPLVPSSGTRRIADRLGLELNKNGFFKNPVNGHPVQTSREGIFVCGTAQGPKGIGESILQACAAASQAAALLAPARATELAPAPEKKLLPVKQEDEPKTAVVICRCGMNIAGLLNMDELVEYSRSLPGVSRVEVAPFACDGVMVKELLGTGDFNRLVLGACSPRTHESLFQLHAEAGGLNKYLLEIVNLRNQCTWVHSSDKAEATEKGKVLMKMGMARTSMLTPLEDIKFNVNQSCLIIGGTPSGVACACKLAQMGFDVHLADKEASLEKIEGNSNPIVKEYLSGLKRNKNAKLHLGTSIKTVQGYIGNYEVEAVGQDEAIHFDVGAIVVATIKDMSLKSNGSGYEEQLVLKRDENGKFIGALGLLNLLDFNTDGVFMCGPAREDLAIEDAVVDGEAATSRVAGILSKKEMTKAPTVSVVVEENCDGCAYCVDPCPAHAITLLEYKRNGEIKKTVEVNQAICKGCGVCMATCPKDGIFVRHFKNEQFSAMVKALMEGA